VTGFSNPIVNPQGKLVIPQVMSPNFNLASPGASPPQSWALLKNGLAYLFGVILSGGTIMGPDYIINTAGAFFYNGAPAAGNLAEWIAPAPGTDAYGNNYGSGINSANAAGGSASITAASIGLFAGVNTILVMSNQGFFLYSPFGAAGNLIGSWAAAAGVDQYGNAYPKGFSPAALVLQSTAVPVIPAAGIALFANANGTSMQVLSGGGQTGDIAANITGRGVFTANGTSLGQLNGPVTIRANDGQLNTVYRLTVGGWGQQAATTAVSQAIAVVAFGHTFTYSGMAASLIAAGAQFYWRAVIDLTVTGAGAAGACRVTGQVTWSGATSSANETLAFSQTADTAIDTTTATTMAFYASWSAVTNSPQMTGNYSVFERLGP
jgi:hypothetical protein